MISRRWSVRSSATFLLFLIFTSLFFLDSKRTRQTGVLSFGVPSLRGTGAEGEFESRGGHGPSTKEKGGIVDTVGSGKDGKGREGKLGLEGYMEIRYKTVTEEGGKRVTEMVKGTHFSSMYSVTTKPSPTAEPEPEPAMDLEAVEKAQQDLDKVNQQLKVQEEKSNAKSNAKSENKNKSQKPVDEEDEEEEEEEGDFQKFDLNSPENMESWGNNPQTEDYTAALTERDMSTLGALLKRHGDHTQQPLKWKSKKEIFTDFYNLKSEKDWSTWIDNLDSRGLAPLTKLAQEYIYNHQNPESCEGKKFIVMKKFPSDDKFGLGALVQAVSTSLTLAIRTDRILVYNTTAPPGEHFIQEEERNSNLKEGGCGRSFDCIFQRLSKCTIDPEHYKVETEPADGEPRYVEVPVMSLAKRVYWRTHPWSFPPVLMEALKQTGVFGELSFGEKGNFNGEMFDGIRYWWRAQSAGFIMRFNEASMTHLREMRMNKVLIGGKKVDTTANQLGLNIGWGNCTASSGKCNTVPMPFPLPVGSFSMHVRHGDKGIEMKLVEFEKYVKRAEKWVKENPLAYRKIGFVSTEDSEVIEQAKSLVATGRITSSSPPPDPNAHNWEWYWSDIPRLNVGPEEQLEKLGGGNRTEMTMGWFLQLVMSLEADVVVGTRGSGWNRMIDQLRCVWFENCGKPFLEVGTVGSWKQYGP